MSLGFELVPATTIRPCARIKRRRQPFDDTDHNARLRIGEGKEPLGRRPRVGNGIVVKPRCARSRFRHSRHTDGHGYPMGANMQ